MTPAIVLLRCHMSGFFKIKIILEEDLAEVETSSFVWFIFYFFTTVSDFLLFFVIYIYIIHEKTINNYVTYILKMNTA